MTLIVLALAGGTAAQATAAENPVVSDCNSNGRLTHAYPASELRTALSVMPATVKEYTGCYDIIQSVLLKQLGQGGANNGTPGSSSGGSFLPTPVIVVIIVVVLGGLTLSALAVRRRAGGGPTGPPR
jgi:hypothetical protein